MRLQSLTAVAFAFILSCNGCSLIDDQNQVEIWNPVDMAVGKDTAENKKNDEIKYGEPVRMAIVWSDTVLTSAAAPPTRGFGGRIYFYDKNNLPVRADGELIIYAYDDTAEEGRNKADRRYEYEREGFQKHFSQSNLGPSYSVWVPWDRVGGQRLSITLLPMFKTAAGQLVRGGQDIVVLPGTSEDDEIERIQRGIPANRVAVTRNFSSVQQGAGQQFAQLNNPAVRTTTISMPRNLAKRLATLPPTGLAKAPPAAGTNRQIVTEPNQQLPPGIHPGMVSELQRKNRNLPNSRITYAGYNAEITRPQNTAGDISQVGTATDADLTGLGQTRVAGGSSQPLVQPVVSGTSQKRRVFGSPGSRY